MSSNKHVLTATDATFKSEVLESKQPVLVDFWAEWCGPCKALSPRIEQLAETYGEKLKVVSIDVDQNTEPPVNYKVRSIPTLLLFKQGQVVGELIGNVPNAQIEDLLKKGF